MLSINISELIWTVVCFFLLYFLLKKFLYGPLVSFMDKREEKINSGLELLEDVESKIARGNAEAEARLSESRSEGQRLIAEAKADFNSRHDELLKKTKGDSARAIAAIGSKLEGLKAKTEQEISSGDEDYARLLLERLLENK